jgi:hypothetical protein
VSTYSHLTGPVFAPADPWTSGEGAVVEAIRLVAEGEAPRILAGASDEHVGPLAELLARVCEADAPVASREGRAALVLVEADEEALARGGRVLARVEQVLEWRGPARSWFARVIGPTPGPSEVFVSRPDPALDDAVASSEWASAARWPCDRDPAGPRNLGASAFLVAAARIARGVIRSALVVGGTRDGGHAVVLSAGDARRGPA